MLSNPSQLLLRNSELLEDKSILLLNHEDDSLPIQLVSICTRVTSLALDYHHFLPLADAQEPKLTAYFGHILPLAGKYELIVIYFPKSKSLMQYLLALAASHLAADGQILIVGENKSGIKSLTKLLPNYLGNDCKLDNARHCLLFSCELVAKADAFVPEQWVSRYSLTTPSGELTICNFAGVFSEKKLDLGTQLLLEHLPSLSGRVLDFGCGAGVIAACLLKAQPHLQLECVDINAMALASCEMTLAANQLTAKVYPSDGLAQTQGMFQAIISNPPFHDGLKETTQITKQFVADSYQKLNKGGKWQIVANSHLHYADMIDQYFGSTNLMAQTTKYKIYQQIK